MSALVKLNLMACVDIKVYSVEYNRINVEMDDLRSKRSIVKDAEIVRRETLSQVCEIDKAIRGRDGMRDLDETLFVMLIEQINVLNKVQVELVLRSEVKVVEILV